MVAKPLCPLYKNIIKPLDRARYPELRYFELSQQEMLEIASLKTDRIGSDPDTCDF